jgi:hypothetical protein
MRVRPRAGVSPAAHRRWGQPWASRPGSVTAESLGLGCLLCWSTPCCGPILGPLDGACVGAAPGTARGGAHPQRRYTYQHLRVRTASQCVNGCRASGSVGRPPQANALEPRCRAGGGTCHRFPTRLESETGNLCARSPAHQMEVQGKLARLWVFWNRSSKRNSTVQRAGCDCFTSPPAEARGRGGGLVVSASWVLGGRRAPAARGGWRETRAFERCRGSCARMCVCESGCLCVGRARRESSQHMAPRARGRRAARAPELHWSGQKAHDGVHGSWGRSGRCSRPAGRRRWAGGGNAGDRHNKPRAPHPGLTVSTQLLGVF